MSVSTTSIETIKTEPGQTALIVTALIVIFALLTFGLVLLIARRRKRGSKLSETVFNNDLEYTKLMSKSLCDEC